jgi:hypothetical protein
LDVAMYKRLLSALPAGIALVQNADKDWSFFNVTFLEKGNFSNQN